MAQTKIENSRFPGLLLQEERMTGDICCTQISVTRSIKKVMELEGRKTTEDIKSPPELLFIKRIKGRDYEKPYIIIHHTQHLLEK